VTSPYTALSLATSEKELKGQYSLRNKFRHNLVSFHMRMLHVLEQGHEKITIKTLFSKEDYLVPRNA